MGCICKHDFLPALHSIFSRPSLCCRFGAFLVYCFFFCFLHSELQTINRCLSFVGCITTVPKSGVICLSGAAGTRTIKIKNNDKDIQRHLPCFPSNLFNTTWSIVASFITTPVPEEPIRFNFFYALSCHSFNSHSSIVSFFAHFHKLFPSSPRSF